MASEVAKEDLNLLSKCPKDRIEAFCHGLIDGFIGRSKLRYKDYGELWTMEEWFKVVDACQRCVKRMSRKQLTKEEISQLFDGVSDEYIQPFVSCVNVRSEDLRKHLLEEVASISHSHLQDFDWKLKLALSNDKISSVQEPLVTVEFITKSGDESKSFSVEMNKEELKQFVSSMEAANKIMVQMKTE
ncbi:COMM domain-containing protein 8-like [Antedon mediterranea]|uniref:COMM domain-containing protein 8-like n=1 Tax=Antedon mediterranea TaxID=105859 RepID=UPI003AF5FDAD